MKIPSSVYQRLKFKSQEVPSSMSMVIGQNSKDTSGNLEMSFLFD